MEESKYYTPEIEEFYVGFEYEEWDVRAEDSYAKLVVREGQKLFMHDYCEYRVKYLDREDMLDLGLIDGDEFGMSCWMFPKKENKDMPDMDGLQIRTNFHEETGVEWCKSLVEIFGDTGIVFRGTIKNKSELKKLLKQLGIDEK